MGYEMCYPNGYEIYAPWNDREFELMYGAVEKHTLVKKDRCYILYQFCKNCMGLKGDFAECGVYKGGTAKLMAMAMSETEGMKKKLWLWDTFEGMPEIANRDAAPEKKGYYGDVDYKAIGMYLRQFKFVNMVKGEIPKTFEGINKEFAFVHIDVDLYKTTKDCLEYFYDRVVSGGIIVCDDYGFKGYEKAAKKAVDVFFKDKVEFPVVLKTGQCVVIKR